MFSQYFLPIVILLTVKAAVNFGYVWEAQEPCLQVSFEAADNIHFLIDEFLLGGIVGLTQVRVQNHNT